VKGASLVLGCVMLLVLSACQSEPTKRSGVPEGFDVPKGVTITDAGSSRAVGRPATVVYQIEQRAASAITIVVTDVVVGDLAKDFQFFNLPEEVQAATPLYVHVRVRNDGPAGLGGLALPIFFLRTTSGLVLPPNDVVGNFRPCPNSALPSSFLAGSKADLCLVFLIPAASSAKSVDIQTGKARDAIHFVIGTKK
jgi:antitoxin component of MazEF toxin-antitoxin module